jgi:hypothetical protein
MISSIPPLFNIDKTTLNCYTYKTMPKINIPDPKDPFEAHPAAREQDRTQPFGVLEEGDQALVNAAHRLPAGERIIKGDSGETIRLFKHESPGQIKASAETTEPDGTTTRVGTMSNKLRTAGDNAISASTAKWQRGEDGGKVVVTRVTDNTAPTDKFTRTAYHDHEAAQTFKLEVADKIETARQHLGEMGVKAAER